MAIRAILTDDDDIVDSVTSNMVQNDEEENELDENYWDNFQHNWVNRKNI